MSEPLLASTALVAAAAVGAPLVVSLARLPFSSIVVELLLGIVLGPHVLGWAHEDDPVRVLSLIGLTSLLFLTGYELDLASRHARPVGRATVSFGLSLIAALIIGLGLRELNLVRSAPLIAITLSTTSAGLIVPILRDAGQERSSFGASVLLVGRVGEIGPIVLLSIFFAAHATGSGAGIALASTFVVSTGVVTLGVLQREGPRWFSRLLSELRNSTAEIRVRAAFLLLVLYAALANHLGLEVVLGAFVAGATVSFVEPGAARTCPAFAQRLRAVGNGIFVPVFFIATGMQLDIHRLFSSPTALLRVPMFLAARLIVHAVSAFVVRGSSSRLSQSVAGGLMQATSISLSVVAGQIGVSLGLVSPVDYVALVLAGLLSVVLYPTLALALLRRDQAQPALA